MGEGRFTALPGLGLRGTALAGGLLAAPALAVVHSEPVVVPRQVCC